MGEKRINKIRRLDGSSAASSQSSNSTFKCRFFNFNWVVKRE